MVGWPAAAALLFFGRYLRKSGGLHPFAKPQTERCQCELGHSMTRFTGCIVNAISQVIGRGSDVFQIRPYANDTDTPQSIEICDRWGSTIVKGFGRRPIATVGQALGGVVRKRPGKEPAGN